MKRLIREKVFRILATLALMSLCVPSAWAWADEPGAEGPSVPENTAQMQTVYVYACANSASDSLAGTANSQGSYTIGTIQLSLPVIQGVGQEASLPDGATLKAALDKADRFAANRSLSLEGARWTSLKVSAEAPDYGSSILVWHLEGVLAATAAAPAGPAVSSAGTTQGSTEADDAAGSAASRDDLPDSELYGAYATATPIDGSDLDIPTIIEERAGSGQADGANPVKQLDEVSLGGAIGDDGVPLGAFDAPVSPAAWVSGFGILATLAYALMVVSRRFTHIDQLRELEQELLAYEKAAEMAQSTVKCAG